jgi:bacterioferritin (cytochrome b1)
VNANRDSERVIFSLVAERIAIDSYSEIIRYLGDGDFTSHRMMEEILVNEEEGADDLRTLPQTISSDTAESKSVFSQRAPRVR